MASTYSIEHGLILDPDYVPPTDAEADELWRRFWRAYLPLLIEAHAERAAKAPVEVTA